MYFTSKEVLPPFCPHVHNLILINNTPSQLHLVNIVFWFLKTICTPMYVCLYVILITSSAILSEEILTHWILGVSG